MILPKIEDCEQYVYVQSDGKPRVWIVNSLRSWRYCVGARLKFWQRSRVPNKGSKDEAAETRLYLQRFRRQISLDYYTMIPSATQARSWKSFKIKGCVVMGSLLKPSGHFRLVKYLLIFREKKNRFCIKPRFESESFRTQTEWPFCRFRPSLPGADYQGVNGLHVCKKFPLCENFFPFLFLYSPSKDI